MSLSNRKKNRLITWVLLVAFAITIKIVSYFPHFVEKYYTYGLYPAISKVLRFITGWLPFSVGDLLYSSLILLVVYQVAKLIKAVRKKSIKRVNIFSSLKKIVFIFLIIFIMFYGLWGLNYSRIGIAGQLGLKEEKFSVQDLDTLVSLLQNRLHLNAQALTQNMRDSFMSNFAIYNGSKIAYKNIEKQFPFLHYSASSIKPSFFNTLMNYWGVQGYYNPFSGEAQINTSIPRFVLPFIVSHEVAHQIGYGKESEANFVSYLVNKNHPSAFFRYSEYALLYDYAVGEMYYVDTVKAKTYDSLLLPIVKKDYDENIAFYKKYENKIQPIINWIYGRFLFVNKQPSGNRSYNEVVNWLIAYYKKFGKEEI